MRSLLLIILFLSALHLSAQKVGLVLSGGAAKGIAHVGILKALEENEIPIDYVVGTSMGGIIAGCYAAGLSPDQIENIVLSDEFLRWVNGNPEPGYNYFYHESQENPNFLRLNLSLDSILNFQLNASIASDVSLNFTLAEKMALASAISKNDFDKLFVPLRVVAADIFTQNQVILKDGLLSDALRATQTVPFFYNPIRVDGKYLFDGGVYNNFPVDVAEKVFKPDVIIGSNVSTKVFNEYPYHLDEKLISKSLLFLLLDKSDPGSVPDGGVYIQPNLNGFTSFDFAQAKSLIDSGYIQTVRQIDEIKSKISSRITCEDVAIRRNAFNNQNPALIFDDIVYKGFNSKQRRYLNRIFKYRMLKKNNALYFEQIKKSYYRLVSEEYFSNVYPNILFDTLTNRYKLQLTRRPQKNFQVDFGGVIATREVSSIFLGLNIFNFNKQLVHFYGGFQTGNFYKAAVLRTRIDFPYQFYLEPFANFHSWNFVESSDLLKETSSPTVLKRVDRSFGVRFGVPIAHIFKGTASFEGLNNFDRYINTPVFVSTDTLDEMRLAGVKAEISFTSNTLNRKQYPSAGKAFEITGQYFNVKEHFKPGNTSLEELPLEKDHQWFRLRLSAEQYFNAAWFRPGYFAEAVFSNQPFFSNYRGTIINAPAFMPIQDSRTLMLEKFRSFNYVAGGIRNVFSLRNKLEFRLEAYVFKPIEYLEEATTQEPVTSSQLRSVFLASSAALVHHSPIGPISLSVNYYDDKENKLGVLLHAGFLLFDRHNTE
ncbi:MAG TPA: patatin-like phospholipase family protein [Chryseosolibacter sp.]|nr:patatin-like phospholipase family protein [Chryseosolibacter sp.]